MQTFEHFDFYHYSKVQHARKEQGFIHIPHSRKPDVVVFQGKKIRRLSDGEIFTVDAEKEEWFLGWCKFITAYDSKNSHVRLWVDNFSSHSEDVAEAVSDFYRNFEIVS